jgi:hypothetical protein
MLTTKVNNPLTTNLKLLQPGHHGTPSRMGQWFQNDHPQLYQAKLGPKKSREIRG